ncbi:MAG: hypothetical protein EBT07_17315 [Actinobacteria bacterium]|nr:hypothetical protein [Actinomycetota bacterium]
MWFRRPDGHGIRDGSPDQFLLSSVKRVDGQVGGAWIVDQDGDGRIVALLPVGPILLLRVKNLDAVVKAVAVSDVGVKKKIRGVVKGEVVVRGKEIEEKSATLGGEVDEVE